MASVVIVGGTPLHAAIAFCVSKAFSGLVLLAVLRHRIPWISAGITHASLRMMRRLVGPAFAFAALPFGNALNSQGTIIVIGLLADPVNVAIFSTLRTLTRIGSQLVGLISNSIWPELSLAFGRQDVANARQLHRRSCQLSLWLAVLVALALAGKGSLVYRTWVGGSIPMSPATFRLLLLVMIANSFWNASAVASLACNAHQKIASVFLASSVGGVVFTSALLPYAGFEAAALSLLLTDIVMAVCVTHDSIHLVADRQVEFWRSILSMRPLALMARNVIQEARRA